MEVFVLVVQGETYNEGKHKTDLDAFLFFFTKYYLKSTTLIFPKSMDFGGGVELLRETRVNVPFSVFPTSP